MVIELWLGDNNDVVVMPVSVEVTNVHIRICVYVYNYSRFLNKASLFSLPPLYLANLIFWRRPVRSLMLSTLSAYCFFHCFAFGKKNITEILAWQAFWHSPKLNSASPFNPWNPQLHTYTQFLLNDTRINIKQEWVQRVNYRGRYLALGHLIFLFLFFNEKKINTVHFMHSALFI